jgi:glycosyltransferase involved in cell wall biosynthesis
VGSLFRFASWLRRHSIDVLQAYFPDSTYFGLPAAWLAGVPHRLRTRNNLGHWLTPMHRFLGRLCNALTTRTITNCRAARDALLATEGPRPASVVVLENGVDLSRFNTIPPLSPPAPGEPARVGVVANLRPVKGLGVLLEATARLAPEHPQLRVEIAGEGEERQALEARAAACGLASRFILRGSEEDIPGFLATLHIAVLCSHAEGMSNALLEYMAAGRAIVATAVGAAPELIADGKHGFLVPPGDPGALAEAINRLLRSPQLAMRVGQAARQRAFHHYSREAMVRRFEGFYVGLTRPEPTGGACA